MNHTLAEIYTSIVEEQTLPQIGIASVGQVNTDMLQEWNQRLHSHHVNHGDKLLIIAQPNPATIALMFAAWHIGAVVCPIPPGTKAENLAIIAKNSGASLIINTEENTVETTGNTSESLFQYRTAPRVTGVDLALIIYTSGSTGQPKGIMLSHTNVLSAIRSIATYLEVGSKDHILSVPPLHFDYGLYQVFFSCYSGCTTTLAPSNTNPMNAMKMVQEYQPTILPLVPALAVGMVRLGKAMKKQYPSVRLITNTGGHLPGHIIDDLKIVFPEARIMPMYGLTESKRVMFNAPEDAQKYPESCGKPMPGIDAKVFVEQSTPNGNVWVEAEADQIGELWVKGGSVMQGYTQTGKADDAGAGARLIPGNYRDDNWLATGDLFAVNKEGFFFFKGREKELIKQAGFCLYPRDIEASVESLEQIDDCAVCGTTDDNGDEIACLFVRTEKPLSRKEVSDWLSGVLDAPYIPKRIEFIEQWPLSVNGKVDKKQLKASLEKQGN